MKWLAMALLIAAVQDTKPAGVELKYRVLFPEKFEGDKKKTCQEVADAVERRINSRGLKKVKITVAEDEWIVLRVPGDATEHKALLKNPGKLELLKAAPKATQEKWNEECEANEKKGLPAPPAPKGYALLANDEKMSGDYAHFGKDFILAADKPVVTGSDLKKASHILIPGGGGGVSWGIDFQLTDEASVKFDEAAKELFGQSPRGLMCIVVDGKILSKPVINSERFGGGGQITGRFTEKVARDLAVVLRNGLPMALGRLEHGKPFVGEPEEEKAVKD